MLKLWTILWVLFTVLIIAFPVWLFSIFLTKRVQRYWRILLNKFSDLRLLEKFRVEILNSEVKQLDTILENLDLKKENNNQEKDDKDKKISEKEMETYVDERDLFIKKKKIIEKITYDALVLRKEWKLEEYEKKIIEWLAINSEDKDLNRLLADLYFNVGNHKKALSLLKKIVELDGQDHKAIWQIWEIYLTSWDFETSELLIEKAITINPNNPKYYISMVELLYNTDRKKDAIEEMEKVIKLRPTNSVYMLTLADLYEELWDLDNSKKYYFRVLEFEPSNEKAKKKLKQFSIE